LVVLVVLPVLEEPLLPALLLNSLLYACGLLLGLVWLLLVLLVRDWELEAVLLLVLLVRFWGWEEDDEAPRGVNPATVELAEEPIGAEGREEEEEVPMGWVPAAVDPLLDPSTWPLSEGVKEELGWVPVAVEAWLDPSTWPLSPGV
jgi:hypothetical protein